MDTRGDVSSVCTLGHFDCAPSSYRTFSAGKRGFPERILISIGVTDLARAPARLCNHRL